MDTLIEANHVSLRFSAPTEKKGSLKKWVLDALRGQVRKRHFLAVDDVSFRIERGEAVGLVGRNGAGKSTLLKLVTGIVTPTAGSIAVRGQVAPLLALGNGLDPTLTGRENIYLNGSILGYEKAYLKAHEADIIDFSELGGFIDAPVRTYSSGMTMRLAFSIATAALPEILILDEVLAVGDAAFQAKCHARIEKTIQDGATVFFVSHNLSDIEKLCTRAIWLEKGRIVLDGPVGDVCPAFREFSQLPFLPVEEFTKPRADGIVPVIRFRDKAGGRHFLTERRPEASRILAGMPSWACEGMAFRAFAEPQPGTATLFRFCNLHDTSHAFVVGEAEAAPYRAAVSDWRPERPVCQVFPEKAPGLVPVFRLRSASASGCRIAVGQAELDAMLAAEPGLAVVGSPFYVFPAEAESTHVQSAETAS